MVSLPLDSSPNTVGFLFLGSFFTSSRLVCAAGRERYLPAIFGRLHPTRHTPLNASFLQAAITIAFIMIGNGFRSLINFSVVASWSFYFLTVEQFDYPHYPGISC